MKIRKFLKNFVPYSWEPSTDDIANSIGKNPNEISLPNNSKIIAIINSSGNINYDYSTDLRVLDKILIQIPLKHEKTELKFLNEKRN